MRLLSAIFSLTVVAYAQTPSVTSASPATANAGGSSFSLTVTGSGFVTGSVVRWSGTPLATTYLGETSLTAAVPANLIAICGRFPLSVLNPGGTTSNTTVSVIVNPVLNGIAPNVVPAGSSGFDVTAFGQGFSSNVVITLNASGGKSNLPTNYS
ncbi:MAG: cell surface receptor domain protein, partial [Candidatus Solibacter sp.]|nr:cell surface receptor domain protein [Candidatus Solibacter sp.]